jgi:hypothetical protein
MPKRREKLVEQPLPGMEPRKPAIPELKPVTSSQIKALGHDPTTSTLFIEFHGHSGQSGSIYAYQNVSHELFMEFITAESVGKFFYARLKDNVTQFPYQKLT